MKRSIILAAIFLTAISVSSCGSSSSCASTEKYVPKHLNSAEQTIAMQVSSEIVEI